jgi:hypothetical protein
MTPTLAPINNLNCMVDKPNRMWRFARRHAFPLQIAGTGISVLAAGVYFAVFQTNHSNHNAPTLLVNFRDLGPVNLLLVPILAGIATQLWATRIQGRVIIDNADTSIGYMLELTARAVVFPRSWGEPELYIRAFCHRLDSNGNLIPFEFRSSGVIEHSNVIVPLSSDFVIAIAFRERKTIVQELPSLRSQKEREMGVWDDIRCILASPIYSETDGNRVVGTISIDTSSRKVDIGFDRKEARDVVVVAARAIASVWPY